MNQIKTYDLSKSKDTWIKAAVIGSLWASIEIILGSFFHNLRLPFAGTVLAFFGNILIIAFHKKWDDKGIILKAGIICALMRSLSITSVILGPMIGVLLEAIFLEYSVRFFGKNLFAYIFGSVLGLLSALIHKIISILIIYGFDIVKILKNLYYFSLKQLNITSLNPLNLILLIILFYVFVGISAALIGFFTKINNNYIKNFDINFSGENNLFSNTKNQKYSVINLFFVLVFIIAGLLILEITKYYISLPVISIYIFILLFKYKNSFRRLRKPVFWIQIFIIIFFAALFFNGFNNSGIFNISGFIVGIKMSFRAILIVISFSVISIELRNPIVKKILYKKGFSRLYMAIGLAFAALPSILKIMAKPRNLLKSPTKQISEIIGISDLLLNKYKKYLSDKQKIIIISGERREGKTTFLKNILKDLDKKQIKYSGIISEGIDKNNKRLGFNIIDLETQKKYKLCSTNKDLGKQKTGKFYFNNDIINLGNKILQSSKNNLVIIDEVGHLELMDKGWAVSIDELIKQKKDLILVVRKKLLEKVIKKWNLSQAQIFDISEYHYTDVKNLFV